MKRSSVLFSLVVLFSICAASPAPASADASHARIVRLGLVQGDVRFAKQFHEDPLTDPKAVWETAPLNLPIREGYVLSTGSGRAEVEFENGAMAFLGDNTVVEFYDLSLHGGGRITRLVLRQGSGIFYVNPATGDYFSVTGGDFTVEANGRTTFRVDNFDDGSTVNVERGKVAVLRNDNSTPLEKGQALSAHAGDVGNGEIGRAADLDDFDHWVSGRIDSVVTATNYANQYVNSPTYTSGFGDLYTYGSWFSVAGYGYGWRPFGVGLGWCPFDYGSWYFDQGLGGWSFLGSAPWGWLPYHYGGWVFSPGYGWLWTPTGFGYAGGGRPISYRPVTAVWVHSNATLGLVPSHPADVRGKTPLNLSQGVYPVEGKSLGKSLAATSGQQWSVVKQVPQETLSRNSMTAPTPTRVSRAVLSGNNSPAHAVTFSRQSSIVYDPAEHRFVNSNSVPKGISSATGASKMELSAFSATKSHDASAKSAVVPAANSTVSRIVPPRPAMTPPSPAHTGGGSSGGSAGTAAWGGRTPTGSVSSSHTTSSGSHPSGGGGGGRIH